MKLTENREIPEYIREFIKEVFGDYSDLTLSFFNEKDCIKRATELIKELKIIKEKYEELIFENKLKGIG